MSNKSSNSINSTSDRGKGLFPKIPEAKIITNGGNAYPNPFYVPPDEDIFKAKEKEQEAKRQEKMRLSSDKIWDKGLKNNNAGKLRKIMEIEETVDTEEAQFDDREKNARINIVEAAKSAINNRIKHRESLPSFVSKKREMFLFQMGINQKKEQIKEFEELAHLQEIGLQKSELMLEEDLDAFNKFLEENKNKCRVAIKLAEDETKRKQEKIQEIKMLQEQKSSVMSKNTKLLEKLEDLYKSKVFLDQLTPPEVREKQKLMRDQRKKQKIEQYGDDPNQDKEKKFSLENYNISINKGLLDLIEDSDEEFDMYFERPDQLQEIFETLEEKNLFTIKYTQEFEQTLEEIQAKHNLKKVELTVRKQQLYASKMELDRDIGMLTKEINDFTHVRKDDLTKNVLEGLESVIKKTYEETLKVTVPADTKLSGYDMLKDLEKRCDENLNDLKKFDQAKVSAALKECNKVRKEKQNLLKKQILDNEAELKRENIRKRMLASKRMGRPIMFKSNCESKEDKEEEKPQVDEGEEDKKKYFTLRHY